MKSAIGDVLATGFDDGSVELTVEIRDGDFVPIVTLAAPLVEIIARLHRSHVLSAAQMRIPPEQRRQRASKAALAAAAAGRRRHRHLESPAAPAAPQPEAYREAVRLSREPVPAKAATFSFQRTV